MTMHLSAPPGSQNRAEAPPGGGRISWRLAGVLAGSLSTLVFTWVHQLTISNIWFMVGPMLIAGATSGVCIAWSFHQVFAQRTVGRWVAATGVVIGILTSSNQCKACKKYGQG